MQLESSDARVNEQLEAMKRGAERELQQPHAKRLHAVETEPKHGTPLRRRNSIGYQDQRHDVSNEESAEVTPTHGITPTTADVRSGECNEQAELIFKTSATSWVTSDAGTESVGVGEPLKTQVMEIICYGAIIDIRCRWLQRDKTLDRLDRCPRKGEFVKLEVDVGRETCALCDPDGFPILQINSKLSQAVSAITALGQIKVEAYADLDKLTVTLNNSGIEEGESAPSVHANLFGPQNRSDAVGALLGAQEVFLQVPHLEPFGTLYWNPQAIEFEDITEDEVLRQELQLMASSKGRKDYKDDWTLVLNNLPVHQSSDQNINIAYINTPLYSHQVDACNYMLKREIGNLDDTMRFWQLKCNENESVMYRHAVTPTEEILCPAEPRSGILADDMGLGKTLSAIALITSSLDRARAYVSMPDSWTPVSEQQLVHARGTLVVVPSLLLLEEWTKELKQHTSANSLRFTRYHDQARAKHFSELLDFDIVLTTYGTVATEFRKSQKPYARGREALYYVQWFRLVLDEAHVIRTQRTLQFEAIAHLQAQHHWCLTGTPISNKIEDLSALLRICRVPILQEPANFNKYVAKVAKRNFRQGCQVLRKTLAPICLRRTKALLKLPEPCVTECLVELSDNELQRYRELEAYSRNLLDASLSRQNKSETRHTMLQAILRLRIFCNLGMSMQIPGNEIEQLLDPDEALALLQEKGESYCTNCACEVRLINQPLNAGSGILGACQHVLCATCLELVLDGQDSKLSYVCHACDQLGSRQMPTEEVSEIIFPRASMEQSAKMQRLVSELLHHEQEKSIVFSAWRKSLDLASAYCRSSGIGHVRIDGSVPPQDRRRALDAFKEDSGKPVLLMTLGTGALGLNLTAATRIHILEPQWNPSVEDQAVDRAVRIGQEARVTVVRYITKDTVEPHIQDYQSLKQDLAAAGFGASVRDIDIEHRLLKATFFQKR